MSQKKRSRETVCIQGGWHAKERRTQSTSDLSEYNI